MVDTLTSPISLLLVEDHQMTLMGLKMLLEKEDNFTVLGEATNGRDAVDKAKRMKPQVILMDIGLPEIDGIEATKQVKEALPDTKILMLTSKEAETDVFAALAAGADAYCLKGINPETLSAAIHAVAEGTAWLDPGIARIVMGRFQGMPPLRDGSAPNADECPLTAREMEVLKLIVEGFSNADIAEELVITKATAKAHVHSILQKLCVDDRTQAAVLAMRQGYV